MASDVQLSIMTSQILAILDSSKTQKPKSNKNETIFSSNKKNHSYFKDYNMAKKKSFLTEVTL